MQNKKNKLLMTLFLLSVTLFVSPLKAQVTVGEKTPPKSFSLLEIKATELKGGLRLPVLTNAQRDALNLTVNQTAAKGLLIFNIDAKSMQYWNGTKWVNFIIPLKD